MHAAPGSISALDDVGETEGELLIIDPQCGKEETGIDVGRL